MSTPLIWIILPLGFALILLILRRQRAAAVTGGILAFGLSIAALYIPIDVPVRIASLSIKVSPSLNILYRDFILTASDRPILALVYGITGFWLFGSLAARTHRLFVPVGMAITAILIAALAVDIFLYAALLIEAAVLLAVPILAPPEHKPGRGVLRFLIYQSMAMPFILFSGWLLSGVEASPGDLALVIQASALLGLGFAFLLAIFPFYTWIPLLMEESPPYAVGFVLSVFPTVVIFLGLGFLNQYSWLRNSPQLPEILQIAGSLMVVTSGIWAAFQRHLGRLMGYALIAEIGVSLLAISLPDRSLGLQLLLLLFIPRTLAAGTWGLGLAVIKQIAPTLRFRAVQGLARIHPFAATGIILANLSLAGVPLLASFPVRQVLWEELGQISILIAFWFGIGSLGLVAGALRSLAVLVMAPDSLPWEVRDDWPQRILLGLSWLTMLVLGLFPQWVQPLVGMIPAIFTQLGQ